MKVIDKSHGFLTEKQRTIIDVPDWFNPEDEGCCIAATMNSVFGAQEGIDPNATCVAEERFTIGVRE